MLRVILQVNEPDLSSSSVLKEIAVPGVELGYYVTQRGIVESSF